MYNNEPTQCKQAINAFNSYPRFHVKLKTLCLILLKGGEGGRKGGNHNILQDLWFTFLLQITLPHNTLSLATALLD